MIMIHLYSIVKIILIGYCFCCCLVQADIYLHNPRGSNNRLDEERRERENDQRLFDSQNNQRGGYNVGNLYYMTGSSLLIEWTAQHSCNNPNSNCDIIIQYMCDDKIRDGSDSRTIPASKEQCNNNNCDTDSRFGMNEEYDYYQNCRQRTRNKGLFIADQRLRGESAIYTRQNPNGDRYAYECAEERDYYPYWHPTKWMDIAILTNDISKCNYFKSESENVKSRWYCLIPKDYNGIIPINKEDCDKIKEAVWTESSSHGIDPPKCQQNQYSRDNHLGNTIGGNMASFNWIIPEVKKSDKCVLRIRYNITTNDYDNERTFQGNKTNLNIKMGLSEQDATNRGYVFKNNPAVQVFADLPFKLNLAINTAQFGRVFQDRSHVFHINNRNVEPNKKIINLNVRGKRGNIVQVYPALEYDFVPNMVEISKGDYIHFQWTGSNKNPKNNDGQGLAGSDRSNVVLLSNRNESKNSFSTSLQSYGDFAVNYPAKINSFLGFSIEDLQKLAFLDLYQRGGSMDELDDAGTYFDLTPKKVNDSGVFHYFCTRNNNFSNRDQKGRIVVYENPFYEELVDGQNNILNFVNGQLEIDESSLNGLTNIRVEIKSKDQLIKEKKFDSDFNVLDQMDQSTLLTDFIIIKSISKKLSKPLKLKLNLKKRDVSESDLNVYRINSDYSLKTKIESKVENGYAKINVQSDGTYIVQKEVNNSLLIGLLIGLGVVLILMGFVGIFLFKNPQYFRRVRYMACNVKRSMADEI